MPTSTQYIDGQPDFLSVFLQSVHLFLEREEPQVLTKVGIELLKAIQKYLYEETDTNMLLLRPRQTPPIG